MKRFSFILALLLVSFFFEIRNATAIVYSPPDSCLKYIYCWNDTNGIFHDNGGVFNPDSILADSCQGSSTFGETYVANEEYLTRFAYNIIPRNYTAPLDSLIEFSINDITPTYTEAIQDFQQLENDYGKIIFRDLYPNIPDTTTSAKRYLGIYFANTIPIDIVYNRIANFASVDYTYRGKYFTFLTKAPENESLKELNIVIENDFLKIINNSGLEISNVSLFDL